jgi:hypothetical protein
MRGLGGPPDTVRDTLRSRIGAVPDSRRLERLYLCGHRLQITRASNAVSSSQASTPPQAAPEAQASIAITCTVW